MRTLMVAVAVLMAACMCAVPASATTTLTFEGIGDLEPVMNYYAGGLGGFGSGPGPNYAIDFSSNALALIDADDGGSGNTGGEPTPPTVLFFLQGGAATMNVPLGFDTGFSFYYSAINHTGFVNVFDGLNATGNLLATIGLPLTPDNGAPDPTGRYSPLLPIGVTFNGIAQSVDFGGSANYIVFDNITLGSQIPTNPRVPELPASLLAMIPGALGILWRRRK